MRLHGGLPQSQQHLEAGAALGRRPRLFWRDTFWMHRRWEETSSKDRWSPWHTSCASANSFQPCVTGVRLPAAGCRAS